MKMKLLRSLLPVIFVLMTIMIYGCSGGGGDGSGSSSPATGTLTIDIADAKPLLPDDTEHVYVTFEELLVHKPGSGWIWLPLVESQYRIDLYQFSDGESTEFVPAVELEAGKYTQVRLIIIDAEIVINKIRYPLTISSNDLKTDKNFDFDVEENAAVNIMIDFDLSKSIVVTGPNEYKLKPVLHIVETYAAARIKGFIAYETFINYGLNEAMVIVLTISKIKRKVYSCITLMVGFIMYLPDPVS